MTRDTASPSEALLAQQLSDAELCETLDLLSTVIASVSDRVDSQRTAIDWLTKTAAETRQAAFAARAQTDPELYAELIAKEVRQKLGRPIEVIGHAGVLIDKSAVEAARVFKEAEQLANEERYTLYREIREREKKADRLKRNLPWFAVGAVVLALGLTIAVPRFYASTLTTCVVIGAEWVRTTRGGDACVFYQE
jgi:hypothetical protein